MNRFENKVVIITGCSKGLGVQIAVDFAKEGAKVVMNARTESGLIETLAKVKTVDGEGLYVVGDASKEETWQEIITKAKDKYGKIDILVNNCGVFAGSTIDKTTLEDWNTVIANDLTSCFLGMHYVVPNMREVGKGVIINLSSSTSIGHKNMFPSVAYSASKAGINGLSAEVANIEAKNNIRVIALCPNGINTGMGDMVPKEVVKMIEADCPLPPHTCEMYDVSNVLLFLASDEARIITGTSVVADCCQTCQG